MARAQRDQDAHILMFSFGRAMISVLWDRQQDSGKKHTIDTRSRDLPPPTAKTPLSHTHLTCRALYKEAAPFIRTLHVIYQAPTTHDLLAPKGIKTPDGRGCLFSTIPISTPDLPVSSSLAFLDLDTGRVGVVVAPAYMLIACSLAWAR